MWTGALITGLLKRRVLLGGVADGCGYRFEDLARQLQRVRRRQRRPGRSVEPAGQQAERRPDRRSGGAVAPGARQAIGLQRLVERDARIVDERPEKAAPPERPRTSRTTAAAGRNAIDPHHRWRPGHDHNNECDGGSGPADSACLRAAATGRDGHAPVAAACRRRHAIRRSAHTPSLGQMCCGMPLQRRRHGQLHADGS